MTSIGKCPGSQLRAALPFESPGCAFAPTGRVARGGGRRRAGPRRNGASRPESCVAGSDGRAGAVRGGLWTGYELWTELWTVARTSAVGAQLWTVVRAPAVGTEL